MRVEGRKITQNDNYFKEIFAKYYPTLCVFASKLIHDKDIAEDLVQDVFIKVWNSDADLQNEKALLAYLYVSAKNTCFSYLKKSKNFESIDDKDNILPTEKNVLDEILRQETYRILEESISSLGEQSQKIIRLTLSGYSNLEIAEELNVSINTIKTLKIRAYKKIKNLVGIQAFTLLMMHFVDILS